MVDYLLISHSQRININNDFNSSHFTVPKGFNLITLHKPGKKLHSRLGYIIQKYLPIYKDNIISTFSNDVVSRRKQLINIENKIILKHISDEFLLKLEESDEELSDEESSNEKSSDDELSDEEFIRLMDDILIDYGLDIPSDIIDREKYLSFFSSNIDIIKDFLHFEIRVYLEETLAPKMLIQFMGGTGSFMGLFNMNDLPEHLFNMVDDIMVTKLLGHSIIEFNDRIDYFLSELLVILLSERKKGNIFMFNCGTYNVPTKKSSLLRQNSDTLQGFYKKYLKYKMKYLKLKKLVSNY